MRRRTWDWPGVPDNIPWVGCRDKAAASQSPHPAIRFAHRPHLPDWHFTGIAR